MDHRHHPDRYGLHDGRPGPPARAPLRLTLLRKGERTPRPCLAKERGQASDEGGNATVYAFDLDGTLADYEAVERTALHEGLREAFGGAPGAELVEALRRALHQRGERPLPGRERMADYWRECLRSAAGDAALGIGDAQLVRMGELYETVTLGELRLYPEVPAVLARCAAAPCILLTNGPPEVQRPKLAALGLSDVFAAVFISGEVGARKPDPAFFAAVAAAGYAPDETLFFGDNPRADVDGGKRAGMRVAWVNREERSFPPDLLPPDHVGRDLLQAHLAASG